MLKLCEKLLSEKEYVGNSTYTVYPLINLKVGMDLWSYQRPVGESGQWSRHALPWEEGLPTERHPDRKITHVYECLVDTRTNKYYSDHSITSIWLQSCFIAVVSPLVSLVQTIYHLVGLGLLREIFVPTKPEAPLSKRCIRSLKSIYQVPLYGFYQTVLALGIVLIAPFSVDAGYRLRKVIGTLQENTCVERYFSKTFQPISASSPDIETIKEIIQLKQTQSNTMNRRLLKSPCYKSPSHCKFIDTINGHLEEKIGYYSRSLCEISRLHRKDYRLTKTRKELLDKVNTYTKHLNRMHDRSSESKVKFAIEKNQIFEAAYNHTYHFIKQFKLKVKHSSTRFSPRHTRLFVYSLDTIYQQALQILPSKMKKPNHTKASAIKSIGKYIRKSYSSFLYKYKSIDVENSKLLTDKRVRKVNRILRKFVKSASFEGLIQKDLYPS